MPDEGYESRTVTSLRTGSKIALLCGLPLLGLAVYFYFAPLMVQSQNGGVFGCGTAANPPSTGWAKGVCQGVPDVAKYRAILCLVLGVLIPGLGIALFGVDKRVERRAIRDERDPRGSRGDLDDYDDDYDDDLDDLDDAAPARSRSGRRQVEADERMSRRGRARVEDDGEQSSRRGARRSFEDDDDGRVPYQAAPRVDR